MSTDDHVSRDVPDPPRRHALRNLTSLPFGLVAWVGPEGPTLTSIVKATYVLPSPESPLVLAVEQPRIDGAPAAPDRPPTDLVPAKTGVDVILLGALPPGQTSVVFGVGGHDRALTWSGAGDALLGGYDLRDEDDAPTTCGVRRDYDPTIPDLVTRAMLAEGRFNAAVPAQRLASLPPETELVIVGATRDLAPVVVAVPTLRPRLWVVGRRGEREVILRVDTLVIDLSRRTLTQTFRGQLPAATLTDACFALCEAPAGVDLPFASYAEVFAAASPTPVVHA